jgi:proline iminopeptidase
MLMEIRGTRLYVDQRGPAQAPALLYLHGGPGSGT